MHRLHTALYRAGLNYIPIRGKDPFLITVKESKLQQVSSLLLSRKAERRVQKDKV